MKTRVLAYKQFGECLWLEHEAWEMGIPLSFGLRILYFSKKGRENVFFEQPEDAGYLCTPEGWRVYGGTRLWFAPESEHSLYRPEAQPVSYAWADGRLVLTQAEDTALHAVKQMEISPAGDSDSVDITYRVTNTGGEPLVGAPWAVSAMRAGGMLTVPFTPESERITAKPERFLSLWNTTSLGDARLTFTKRAAVIRQKPLDAYFKMGFSCAAGTAKYELPDQAFIKTFPAETGVAYPDGGVNLEVYTCRWMLEFETLAATRIYLPGETAEHTERWTILERKETR